MIYHPRGGNIPQRGEFVMIGGPMYGGKTRRDYCTVEVLGPPCVVVYADGTVECSMVARGEVTIDEAKRTLVTPLVIPDDYEGPIPKVGETVQAIFYGNFYSGRHQRHGANWPVMDYRFALSNLRP